MGFILLSIVGGVGVDLVVSALIESWYRSVQSDGRLFTFIASLTLAGTGLAALRFWLTFHGPINTIDRLHTLFFVSLLGRRHQNHGAKTAGRLTQDFFNLELEAPNRLITLGAGVVQAVVYCAIVAVSSPFALLLLVPVSMLGYLTYRSGKTVVIAASNLRAAVRGPVFNLASTALSCEGYRLSRPLREALDARFTFLVARQAVGNHRSMLATLAIRGGVGLFRLCLFLGVLWGVVLYPGFGLLTPALAVYVALQLSQNLALIIEHAQEADVLLTQLRRLAELLERENLPSWKELATIPRNPRSLYESLVDPGDHDGNHKPTNGTNIDVRSVSVRTPAGHQVFDQVSFSVPSRGRWGLTGPSGVGKSTLARIISGCQLPDAGSVLIRDQAPLNTSAHTRALVLLVESDVPPLPISIRSLIDPWNNFSDQQIATVLRRLDDTMEAIPLATQLQLLSHGQRQIALLGRALLLRPEVLIIDEGTSALDSARERRVLGQLFTELTDTTCFVILHRRDNHDLFDTVIELLPGGRGTNFLKRPRTFTQDFQNIEGRCD